MSKPASNILGAFLATLCSLALFRLCLFNLQVPNYVRGAEISYGVTTGYPVWETFQSRVLAPYVIKFLSLGSHDWYVTGHIWFQIVTIAIAAFLCWRLGRKHGGDDQGAILGLGLFVMTFALLLSPLGIYSWDFLDIIVFIIFIDLVLSRASLHWFVILFAVAILNRDSAIFIALWLVVNPFARYLYRLRYKLPRELIDWRQVITGGASIVIGLAIAELLKRSLLIKEIGPELYPNSPISGGNRYNIVLLKNITNVKNAFSVFSYQFEFIIVVFLLLACLLGANLARRDPEKYLGLYLVELALVASLLTFGWYDETRIYLILIPFIVASSILVVKPRAGA